MDIDLETRRKGRRPAPGRPAPLQVGAKLQRLRQSRGWTLQQASKATGVALSTLSKIEREELSPTVTTLARIAQGFSVDVPSLLADAETPGPSGRRSITRAPNGSLSSTGTCDNVWLCNDLARKKMTPIRTRVRARTVDEYPEWARYNAEVFLTVLKGTLIVHSEIYAPTELHEGDSLYYDAASGHVWTSVGEEDAEVLWVYAE